MPKKLLVGPILGLESDKKYTVCFLTEKHISAAKLIVKGGLNIKMFNIMETPHGTFWRATFDVLLKNQAYSVSYQIEIDNKQAVDQNERSQWTFYLPAKNEKPRIAYASCNGFSTADLHQKARDPYCLWRKMVEMHGNTPFSLLIMGGDQVYADSIWEEVPSCRAWKDLSFRKKIKKAATQKIKQELDRFYEDLYIKRWKNDDMSMIFASIPSLMMWDDHDIFDGWGSYPEELQQCPTYQVIFSVAKRYFELFQIRSIENSTLLSKNQDYYSFGLQFRNFYILGLDNRSQRTLSQVMSDKNDLDNTHWKKIIQQLTEIKSENLLVLSGLPLIYRDFSSIESFLDITPWQEELTDDLKDHWRAKEHQGERMRLIMHLLNAQVNRVNQIKRTVILSGDVHIGCLGALIDRRSPDLINRIYQVIASGIVHPPPSRFEWFGITAASNGDNEFLNIDKTIEAAIINLVGSDQYLRTRNFAYLEEGDDGNLWANWICEVGYDAEYPLQ